MLGHALWQRRFGGDPNVLGQVIRLSGVPYTVVGILPAGISRPDRRGRSLDPADDARGRRVESEMVPLLLRGRTTESRCLRRAGAQRRDRPRPAHRRGHSRSARRLEVRGDGALAAGLARRSAHPPLRARAARSGGIRAAHRLRQPGESDPGARRDAAARGGDQAGDRGHARAAGAPVPDREPDPRRRRGRRRARGRLRRHPARRRTDARGGNRPAQSDLRPDACRHEPHRSRSDHAPLHGRRRGRHGDPLRAAAGVAGLAFRHRQDDEGERHGIDRPRRARAERPQSVDRRRDGDGAGAARRRRAHAAERQ